MQIFLFVFQQLPLLFNQIENCFFCKSPTQGVCRTVLCHILFLNEIFEQEQTLNKKRKYLNKCQFP